jgi:hypothetical protein
MTVSLEAPPAQSASLTTSHLEAVQRVWRIAGLPPTAGYAATLLAIAVATNKTLAATLTTVNFDDADSVANAVEELLQWRQHFPHTD